MIRPAKRWLVAIVSTGLTALGLPAAATTAAQAVPQQTVPQQSGHFWPGNLLNMDNADFENGVGDWNAISNVSTLTTDTTAFLHNEALKIVASGTPPITSVLQLSGTSGIQIDVHGGATYRVGAYVEMPPTSGHTTEFDLGCYDANGNWLGWAPSTAVSNSSDGNWHWVEDDIALPSGCTHVQGSPRVQFTGMHDGGTIHMDEVWFAPKRAALMIGAYAPSAADWINDDTPGTKTYIGPLQSIKIFFGNNEPDLPNQWSGTSTSPNKCYGIEQSINTNGGGPYPACVINLNPVDPTSRHFTVYPEPLIQGFLAGMPPQQTVIFVYHDEPEGDSFTGCPGAPAGDNAANFICYFEEESSNISMAAAHWGRTENVFTADDSASSQYVDGGAGMSPTKCGWIVPSSGADFYFEDHYERGWANGSNLSSQSGSSKGQQQWSNWLGCVSSYAKTLGKPIGLAEYGLCSGSTGPDICGQNDSTCTNASASTVAVTNTMAADDGYLAAEPSGASPTLLWEYWYDKCWQFDNSNNGMTKWRSIENESGGAVGG